MHGSSYVPIAHTHPIAIHGQLDPLDYNIWMPLNDKMMASARGLVMVMMRGWEESVGMRAELESFQRMNKPVVHLPWPQGGRDE